MGDGLDERFIGWGVTGTGKKFVIIVLWCPLSLGVEVAF